MPKFRYEARDRAGNAAAGVIEADDHGEVRRILRLNDLYLIRLKNAGVIGTAVTGQQAAPTPTKATVFDAKPNIQDLVIATRQLGTLIRAGMPMAETLEIVGSQSDKVRMQIAFREIQLLVMEGQSLSVGMRKFPDIFNPLVLSLVEAGEVAGTLEHTLEVAAKQLDREAALRRKVKSAMLYPKIVLAACVGTIALMLLLVVPVFATVYREFHSTLPGPTLLLMALSDLAVHWWWAVLLGCLAAAYAYQRYAKTPGGRRRLDIIGLKLPVFGPLFRKIAIARFVQTLSGAMSGGVPVLRSLGISGATAGNTVIRDAVTQVALRVRDGSSIGTELAKTGEFPMMVTRMISAGESGGQIDTMLDEINRFYEQDVETATERLTRIIEPLMTVMVGSIVLLVLLALYMPIFSLGKAIRDH
ncbi:MAG TPA: type II secretion system F family protein [Fimbriimonas sp.]|nr:type II secretion system F family protein [Fimbriimonas sp.]